MKAWIEVSTDYRLGKKISGEVGLIAPASSRYMNMMKDVNKGDIILHYIIKQGATKSHESRIIAISMVESGILEEPQRIVVHLKELVMLPIPITLNEIKAVNNQSDNLKKLIRMSFLRYLPEITIRDLKNLLKIHMENIQYLNTLKPYKNVLGE